MARPREFDLEQALERAMQKFWAQGYEATSLDDLCDATGLGRSSLYAAFGDKRGIYLRALAHYEEAAVKRITATLHASASPLDAIRAFVKRIIDDIVAGPGRRGGFFGNCAAELARQDRAAASQVKAGIERVQAIFQNALLKAQRAGELPREADTGAIAAFLVSGIQGLRLVGKANPERKTLENIAKVMLRCIEH